MNTISSISTSTSISVYFVKSLKVYSVTAKLVEKPSYEGANVSFNEETEEFSGDIQVYKDTWCVPAPWEVSIPIQEFFWSGQFDLEKFPAWEMLEDAQAYLRGLVMLEPTEFVL